MSESHLARGVVLAVNFVPDTVENNIAKFWAQATACLAQKGYLLIVATTASLNEPGINSIEVPFSLLEFPRRFPLVDVHDGNTKDDPLVDKLQTWYRCDEAEALRSVSIADSFYADLFKALEPCAVLTWQSTHPKSVMLQRLARAEGIPVWNAERGWLRDTMMIDLADNHYLNELHTSFALSQCLYLVPHSDEEYETIRARSLGGVLTGRYTSNPVIDAGSLRAKYDIPPDARLFAFFMHGEPFVLMNAAPLPAHLHGMSLSLLQEQLQALALYCEQNDIYLLVQDHPFNDSAGIKLDLPGSSHVVPVAENIHSVLEASDRCFFTTSTIQYDAILYGKPYGLLCRTSADVADGAFCDLDYPSTLEFARAVDSGADWESRHANLRRLITFLSKVMLFDITDAGRDESVERFAAHLTRFVRPIGTDLSDRIDGFLDKWRSAS